MKLRKITIHNIASICDATIDFTASPLDSSPVFLIAGKTGAGKSTILDAICLALYANTPRMKGNRIQGKNEEELSLKDTRQLLRRDTGEGFARLEFIGSNGHEYVAEWGVKRARGKSDGKLQPKQWELRDLTDGRYFRKDTEIEEEIRNHAVGLDFTQFCRTTMLAQGEFTRFLNSDDREKADILEKITGVDIYSRISSKLFAMAAEKADAYDRTSRELDNIGLLTDEELAKADADLEEFNKKLADTRKAKSEAEAKLKWLTDEIRLARSLAEADEALVKARGEASSESANATRQLIGQWNATINVRFDLRRRAETLAEIAANDSRLLELARHFSYLLHDRDRLALGIDASQARLTEMQQFIESESPRKAVYESAQSIIALIDRHLSAEAKSKEASKSADDMAKVMEEKLLSARDQASRRLEDVRKRREEAELSRNSLTDKLEKLDLPGLRKQKDSLVNRLHQVDLAENAVGNLSEATARRREQEEEAATVAAQVEESKKIEASLAETLELARQRRDKADADLQRQNDTVETFICDLRSRLDIGDTCPLCGQEIKSALPRREALEALCKVAREAFECAVKDYDKAREAVDKNDALLKSRTDDLQRLRKRLTDDKSVDKALAAVITACNQLGIGEIDAATVKDVPARLEAISAATKAEIDRIAPALDEATGIEKQRDQLVTEITAIQKELDKAAKSHTEAVDKANEQQAKIDTARAIAAQHRVEAEETKAQYLEAVAGVEWAVDPASEPKAFAAMLKEATEKYADTAKQVSTLDSEIALTRTNLSALDEIIGKIKSARPDWAELEPAEAADSPRVQPLGLLSETESVIAANARLSATAGTLKESIGNFLKTNPDIDEDALSAIDAITEEQKQSMEAEIARLQNALTSSEAVARAAREAVEAHQSGRPQLDEGTTADTVTATIEALAADEQSSIERMTTLRNSLAADTENRKLHSIKLAEIDKLRKIHESWEELSKMFGSQDGKKFRQIAQSYVLTSLIDSANVYMARLSDRYTLSVIPGTFIINIVDAYQDYTRRAASTISGGESFLVSLALALALSDIRDRLSVDTLFIDEGFGSLSGEPLAAAVETLRDLHNSSGRRVGIISHIEELRERIPTQIQVNQSPGSSSSEITTVC